MRAVRLGSSAIGNDAQPQTDAPRAIFVLALIAAAGVALPWAEGFRWSKHGYSYDHGLVALAAAAASALVCALRLLGVIDRRPYFLLALTSTLIGLGSTLVFYFDVIGTTHADPFLFAAFRPFVTEGAIGLYMSTAGFLAQAAFLIWHVDLRIQRHIRIALRSPWAATALVAVAAVGVLLPWSNNFAAPGRGLSFNEGLIALVAAIEAAIVCGLRVSGSVRVVPYALVGLLSALCGLGAVVWFHNDVVSSIKPTGYPLLVWWLNAPRSGAGPQESVSAAGFIGAIAVLTWQLWQGRRELRRLHLPRQSDL